MDQLMEHVFVNKPFYKSYRKCTGCGKRKIFSRIAKCSGCKIYCHRRCVQLDNACFKPDHVEPTAQVTVPDLETTVTRSSEDDGGLTTVLRSEEDDRDLCPVESDVCADRPDSDIDVSCTDSFKSAERQPCAPEDDNFGTCIGLQDDNSEAINDQLIPDAGQYAKDSTPSDDVTPADDECSTALAEEEVQVDEALPTPSSDDGTPADEWSTALAEEEVQAVEAMSTPYDDGVPADEISSALAEDDVQVDDALPTPSDDGSPAGKWSTALAIDEVPVKSIQGCSDSKPKSCTEADKGECQNDDDSDEKNKCCYLGTEKNKRGDDGDQDEDVHGERMLD